MQKILSFLIVAMSLAFTSCSDEKSTEHIIPRSNGAVREIMVVIENELWRGEVGDALRDAFASPMVGMPQDEAYFRMIQIPRPAFSSYYNGHRNIMFVEVRDTLTYSGISNDLYAKPQKVTTMVGDSERSLIKLIKNSKEALTEQYIDADNRLFQFRFNQSKHNKLPNLKELEVNLTVPKAFRVGRVEDNFIWYLKDLKKGSVSFMVSKRAMSDESELGGNLIISDRDSLTQRYIGGEREGSYMAVADYYTPIMSNVEIDKKFAIETRGLWTMENDFMGGPFLSYTIFDEENQMVYTLDGFVYLPSEDKRFYVAELQAIFDSFEVL